MSRFEQEAGSTVAPRELLDEKTARLGTDERYKDLGYRMDHSWHMGEDETTISPAEVAELLRYQEARAAERRAYRDIAAAETNGEEILTEVDLLPTTLKELRYYYVDNLRPIALLPEAEFKRQYNPELANLYRNFLKNKVEALINGRPSADITYPDTVAAVVGNDPGFLQKAIFSETGQVIDMDQLLQTPFSHIASEFGIQLPDNYAAIFSPRQKQRQ